MDIKRALQEAAEVARPAAKHGQVADYIPEMADLDPDAFAFAVVELDGTEHVVGDVDVPFPIQSMSKAFSLVLAMQLLGDERGVADEIWSRVGREPSGDPFNSLVQLEHEEGIPRNPMINAGALVIDDILLAHCDDPSAALRQLLRDLSGEDIEIDAAIAASEIENSHRNLAMANLMASFGNITNDIDAVLETYIDQCATKMTTRQIARSMRFLANDGIDPTTGRQILPAPLARRVAAIMLTCGTYDASGEFAFSVGLPCKSGVAGGIMAFVPDHSGLCVWSPPLDDSGNSLAGRAALHEFAARLELSIF